MKKDAKLVAQLQGRGLLFPRRRRYGAAPRDLLRCPSLHRGKKQDLLLPYLVEWKDDLILRHSRAYLNVPDEGFHLPSGVLHAPGTALTIELQEDSDVFAMLQALNAGKIISKELLFKDVIPRTAPLRRAGCPGPDRLGAER